MKVIRKLSFYHSFLTLVAVTFDVVVVVAVVVLIIFVYVDFGNNNRHTLSVLQA